MRLIPRQVTARTLRGFMAGTVDDCPIFCSVLDVFFLIHMFKNFVGDGAR